MMIEFGMTHPSAQYNLPLFSNLWRSPTFCTLPGRYGLSSRENTTPHVTVNAVSIAMRHGILSSSSKSTKVQVSHHDVPSKEYSRYKVQER